MRLFAKTPHTPLPNLQITLHPPQKHQKTFLVSVQGDQNDLQNLPFDAKGCLLTAHPLQKNSNQRDFSFLPTANGHFSLLNQTKLTWCAQQNPQTYIIQDFFGYKALYDASNHSIQENLSQKQLDFLASLQKTKDQIASHVETHGIDPEDDTLTDLFSTLLDLYQHPPTP